MAGRGGGEGGGGTEGSAGANFLIWDNKMMSWVILFKCNSIPNRWEIKQRHSLEDGKEKELPNGQHYAVLSQLYNAASLR